MCIYASTFADWRIYAVLFVLCFGIFINNRNISLLVYVGLVIMKIINSTSLDNFNIYTFIPKLGMFVPVLFIYLYNGQLGIKKGSKIKWLFYIIYPLQFIVIYLIKLL